MNDHLGISTRLKMQTHFKRLWYQTFCDCFICKPMLRLYDFCSDELGSIGYLIQSVVITNVLFLSKGSAFK